ncbi:patatin-like phospholipase family protein [Telluribacter sp.]|jgi:NTE family protein|uniref:patatin-like phospholipase family protein n=1 Tax=Telluribacter sp. TaxID=1978767 RepID=UPI002E155AD2|nr:patatin-like phospholipase family protein [Telluribacter sp.]
MKALVLGGGSIKGAFQVGAIQAVLESGFKPDMVYGISVGALNSTFLVNEAGRQAIEEKEINWPSAGRYLLEFWIKSIAQPQDIALLRSRMALGVYTLMSRYDGLLDPSPLHNLIRQNVEGFILRNSPIKLKVGAVNITSGELIYASPQDEFFMDYVMASASLPMLMPAVPIGSVKDIYMDGGLREVAPVRQAIEDGATDVVIVACHSKKIYHPEGFRHRNLVSLFERVRDITINQIANNDINWAENYAERSVLRGKNMKLTVVRPSEPLVLNLQHFTEKDISRLIVEGYKQGLETMKRVEEVKSKAAE